MNIAEQFLLISAPQNNNRYEKLMLRRIDWAAADEEEEEGDHGAMEIGEPKQPNYCRLVWQVRSSAFLHVCVCSPPDVSVFI